MNTLTIAAIIITLLAILSIVSTTLQARNVIQQAYENVPPSVFVEEAKILKVDPNENGRLLLVLWNRGPGPVFIEKLLIHKLNETGTGYEGAEEHAVGKLVREGETIALALNLTEKPMRYFNVKMPFIKLTLVTDRGVQVLSKSIPPATKIINLYLPTPNTLNRDDVIIIKINNETLKIPGELMMTREGSVARFFLAAMAGELKRPEGDGRGKAVLVIKPGTSYEVSLTVEEEQSGVTFTFPILKVTIPNNINTNKLREYILRGKEHVLVEAPSGWE